MESEFYCECPYPFGGSLCQGNPDVDSDTGSNQGGQPDAPPVSFSSGNEKANKETVSKQHRGALVAMVVSILALSAGIVFGLVLGFRRCKRSKSSSADSKELELDETDESTPPKDNDIPKII